MMTHAALNTLSAHAQCTPEAKPGVLVVGPETVLEPRVGSEPGAGPESLSAQVPEATVHNSEQVRKLVHSLAAAALLACTVCAASAAAAVAVTPLSEEVFTAPINNVSIPADKRSDGGQTGPLIPLDEWKRYCNRPNALGPHPQGRVAVAEAYPNGAAGYVRDPAYLPVLPMEQPKAHPRKTKKKAASPDIASPVVPGPTVVSPTVAPVTGPKPPTVAGATAPTSPAVPATGPVASPYSSVAPATGAVTSPTNPASPGGPMSPSSPSLAAQSPAQDGVMATGRGIAADATRPPAGNGNGAAASVAAGTQSTTGERRPFLGGAANTLVVPPEGISLQPNNGAAALTAPAQKQ